MRCAVYVAFAGLLIFVSSTFLQAQSTAQISGTVRDQSGAVLPGVEITATQIDTGVERSSITNETGSYVLSNLALGPYRLEATLPGFRTYVQTGVVLQVNASPVINPVLEVGQVAETIEVQANAALVETRSAGVGTVVDNQRVLELPLNGRNVTELVSLAGMAVSTNQTNVNTPRNYPTIMLSVGGGISNGVTYLLDGASHNDPENNLNLPLPFPDALQEFKVENSALLAQYGYHSAASVSAVTKSGTNEFHGNAFEFVRNGVFNARDFFAIARDNLKRNQFGGVIGGPVVKNKLFFFGGYQGTAERSAPPQNIAYVPTPAMLAGDFTTVTSPQCAGRQLTLAASLGFVNNRISPDRFNPSALKILSRMIPSADPCGKVTFGWRNNQNEHVLLTRMDYTRSTKESLFGRFFLTHLTQPSTYDGKNIMTVNRNGTNDWVYSLALGQTYLFGSNTVSSARLAVTRTRIEKIVDNMGSWSDYGVNIPYAPAKLITATVAGGFALGGGMAIISNANTGPNYNAAEDLSFVRGTHQFGIGVSYVHTENSYKAGVRSTGSMTFNGQATGLGLADFLLGLVAQFEQGNLVPLYNRQHYVGMYAQDSWKMSPKVTVNYGLRWEPYLPISSKYGWLPYFDKKLFDQGVHTTQFVNAPVGLILPGDPQYECGKKIECNRWNQFLPRVGLAWDPGGDGRMSIRAAYGMFSDRDMLISLTGYGQNVPFGNRLTLTNVGLSNPWATYPGGNPFPIAVDKNMVFPQFGTFGTHPFHVKPTVINQWNVSIQRQLGRDWLLTANYVGSSTSHLHTGNELNPAVFLGLGPCTINGVNYSTCSTTANTNQRRRFFLQNPQQGQYYGSVAVLDDGGTGNYNGLFLSAQKRISQGVSVLANYTWSHCISDLWTPTVGAGGGSTVHPDDRRAERSNCLGTDQRHLVNLSAVLQTPSFSSRGLRLIASNWQLAPILKIRSGPYFTVTGGVDYALNGVPQLADQRPNQVLASPYASQKTVDHWLNPLAFVPPALGTYGNLGKNNMVGPGAVQLDVALSRTFSIGEKKTIQLRAEAFNLPNRLNPSTPVAVLNNVNFGKIQSDISGTGGLSPGDPRILQFALKLGF